MLQKLKSKCDPKVIPILDKLDQQTTKLSTLVQQLMDVSQIENGSLVYSIKKLNFSEFLTDVVSMLSHVHSNYHIKLELSDTYYVNGDRLRLEQVFTNLIGNAAKYSPIDTQITVSYQVIDHELIITVKDQGQGMNKDSLKSIFEKFYRNSEVEATHPGLGMGLYITSKIVVDHGGKIWAESQRNIGSIFYVSLPLVTE
ncbi:Alkaline phosphatase synthesis sensor protein PhoR [compost metagenome]